MSNRVKDYFSQFHCLATGCNKNHMSHYCNVCKDKDADHIAEDCQNIVYNIKGKKVKKVNIGTDYFGDY